MRDQFEFFRQFRKRFSSTGSVLPSSRFLARAMIDPLKRCDRPVRILEVGPGTGAVTREIVRMMGYADWLDLVEINGSFTDLLKSRFQQNSAYCRVAHQCELHTCPVQEFRSEEPYDYIISGLPLNNFPTDLVQEIFEAYFRLLAPGGVLSYFEYMYVRPIRKVVGKMVRRPRIIELDGVLRSYLNQHRFQRSWVFCNFPPAWVQHLRHAEELAPCPPVSAFATTPMEATST